MLAHAGQDLLLRTRALLPALNEQERKVGQYLLDHPAEVAHLTIGELAARCGVSDATVFRFSRKVGAEGYHDLKLQLMQALALETVATYDAPAPADSLEDAVRKAIEADLKAVRDTATVLDREMLERAIEALDRARRVDIYGSGGGAVAALELQYRLIRVGIRGVAYTDAEMQVISASLLTSADVAVGISHSGEPHDILRAMAVAGESGATLIAITNHPASPIGEMAGVRLVTAAQESSGRGYSLGTRVAQMALIDALYAGLTLRRREEQERNVSLIGQALYHREP